jgi:DNA-binding HxlR family transcriptional regulator
MAKTRVRGSRTSRPIMVLLDLLGRRWALRVLWELRGEQLSFRELQDACGKISPTVLNDRLRELRDARLVELDPDLGYGLSALGADLVERFLPVVRWADRWARRY